jgi:hypothetical protein
LEPFTLPRLPPLLRIVNRVLPMVGPGQKFTPYEFGQLVADYAWKAYLSLRFLGGTAKFHHAGRGVAMASAALPRELYRCVCVCVCVCVWACACVCAWKSTCGVHHAGRGVAMASAALPRELYMCVRVCVCVCVCVWACVCCIPASLRPALSPPHICRLVPWDVGMHHSLGLLLYLMDDNKRFEDAFRAEVETVRVAQSTV